jgi:hypothetical protein
MRRTLMPLLAGIGLLGGIAAAAKAELDGGWAISKWREWRRDLSDWQLARGLPSVPCPASALVIAALGQSNAGNHLGPRVPADPALPAFAFFRDRCTPLSDPVPGATGSEGSLWTDVAHQLARQSGRPVVIIAGAAASSSVKHWSRDTAGMTSRALRSITAAAAAGLAPQFVIWLQGEADSEARMDEATYAALLEGVIAKFNLELANRTNPATASPTWIITQTSRCWGEHTRSEEVRRAQRRVAKRIANAYIGPDTDALGDAYRRDGCHFGAAGRQRLAAEMVETITSVAR